VRDAHVDRLGAQDVELARALLPVLLARIVRTTGRLTRIEERLALEPAADTAPELAREAQEAESLGWLLGCLSGGLGSELLLERHEPRALELALGLVAEALGQPGRGLRERGWPSVSKAGGWRLAWALAGIAWRAVGVDPRVDLELARSQDDPERFAISAWGPPSSDLHARGGELERELEGTRFEAREVSWSWSFPADWLEGGR
jgi:hypothetical protein